MVSIPFPDNQDKSGTAYESLAGFDATKNLVLAHFDELSPSPIVESAQGLVVDQVGFLTGAGTVTQGVQGLFPTSKAIRLDNRGGFGFGSANGVFPANDEFTVCYWSYQEAGVWPAGFRLPFSRGRTSTYVAYGFDGFAPSVAGRTANVAWGNSPTPSLVQTWNWHVIHFDNNGPGSTSRMRHWTHVGLSDTVGTANPTVSGTPLLDFATEFAVAGGGTPSPFLFGREYLLGPALPLTSRFAEFAIFEGPAWDDATRQGIYERQAGLYVAPPSTDPGESKSAKILFFQVAGLGDVDAGQWKISTDVPAYGGDEFKPWLTQWPDIRPEKVDELGSTMTVGEFIAEFNDGDQDNPGALSSLVRLFGRPSGYTAEDVAKSFLVFLVENQGMTPADGDLLWLGHEVMLRGPDVGPDIQVTRAQLGTEALNHPKGSPIYAFCKRARDRRLSVRIVDADATSSAEEENLGEYVLDRLDPSDDATRWTIGARSRLLGLTRKLASGISAPAFATRLSNSGVLFFEPTGSTDVRGNPLIEGVQNWSDGGFVRLGSEIVQVQTGGEPMSFQVVSRGLAGSDVVTEVKGESLESVLVAAISGPGAFRWSPSNSIDRNVDFQKTTHWVDILLCLITSSGSTDDDLELVNGDATYGNWSALPVGWGIGIPIDQIDVESFILVKQRTLTWNLPGLKVMRDAGPFAQWATSTLLGVVGAFLVTFQGKLKLKLSRMPDPLTLAVAPEFNIDNLLGRPKSRIDSSRLVSDVVYRLKGPKGQEVTDIFRDYELVNSASSGGRYESGLNSLEIDAPGLIASETGSPSWIRAIAYRRLIRRAQERALVSTVTPFENRSIGPGDVVKLSAPNLYDLESGTLGWTDVPCEVLEMKPRLTADEAAVDHEMVVYEGSKYNRNIAPAALGQSVSVNTLTVYANRFSQADAIGLPVTDAEAFEVGMKVGLRNLDGTPFVGFQTIVSISGDDIELDGDFGGLLIAERVLVLAPIDDSRVTDRDRFGHAGSVATGNAGTIDAILREYGEP